MDRRERQNPLILFKERLRVPRRWWLMGALLVASFWLAMIVAVPPTLAWVVTGVCVLLLTALLRAYGSAAIVVDPEWLFAGLARIERHHLGAVRALDASEMRLMAGPRADARAFLVLRPYIPAGVQVMIQDADDPAPYWLISSRRPAELAEALRHLTRDATT